MKVGDLVQYVAHKNDPIDSGIGHVLEIRPSVDNTGPQWRVVWGCDIIDGQLGGSWFSLADVADGAIVVL